MQIDNIIQFNLLLMLTLTYVALLIRAGTNDFRGYEPNSTFSKWNIPSSARCTMFGKLHFLPSAGKAKGCSNFDPRNLSFRLPRGKIKLGVHGFRMAVVNINFFTCLILIHA